MTTPIKIFIFLVLINTSDIGAALIVNKQNILRELTKVLPDYIQNPEIPPNFKDGGTPGLKKFISKNLRYPDQCVEGKVYVGFVVDSLGNVQDIEIKKGITKETDTEAVRLVKLMTFVPGTINGKPANMKMVLSINFTIQRPDNGK